MKKILLGIGTIVSVVAPIATVVSCGSDSKDVRTWTEDFTNDKTSDQVQTRYWKLVNHRSYDTVGADEAHFIFINGKDKFDLKMSTDMTDKEIDDEYWELDHVFMKKVYAGVTGEAPTPLERMP